MSSYLITGCSRGLGLAFVRELAQSPPSIVRLVIATSRSEQPPAQLQKIIDTAPDRIRYVPLDVTSATSIAASVALAAPLLGDQGLDILINNAGISQPHPGRTATTLPDDLTHTFTTNVTAVHAVTQAYLPLLRRGRAKKLVNVSSTMGSIGLTAAHPGFFRTVPTAAYNVSKAALNSLTLQYAVDLADEGFTVLPVSPGHLQTDLGGGGAPLTADVGARATLDIVHAASAADSGRFRNIFVEGDAVHDGRDPVW